MAHAQKPDFVFRRNGRDHLNRRKASVQSTTGSRGVRISCSNAGYTMFRGSVKWYWLPTPFASFPFTSPPLGHRVPSHFNWTLPHESTCSIDSREDGSVGIRFFLTQNTLAQKGKISALNIKFPFASIQRDRTSFYFTTL